MSRVAIVQSDALPSRYTGYGLGALLVGVLVVSAPAAAARRTPATPMPSANEFVISSTELEVGIARGFFYNDTTVIEFSEYPLYFSVEDNKGQEIPYVREGKYARLKGRHERFSASVDGKKVTFAVPRVDSLASATKPAIKVTGPDFSYDMTGDASTLPLQVFDDGSQTYIQFKAGQEPPAIFVAEEGKHKVALLKAEPPYQVYKGTANEFVFVAGANKGSAVYRGKRHAAPRGATGETPTSLATVSKSLSAGETIVRPPEPERNTTMKLADALEKRIPADYKVFVESGVDIDATVIYDETRLWADALLSAGLRAGFVVHTDYAKKQVFIKSRILSPAAQATTR